MNYINYLNWKTWFLNIKITSKTKLLNLVCTYVNWQWDFKIVQGPHLKACLGYQIGQASPWNVQHINGTNIGQNPCTILACIFILIYFEITWAEVVQVSDQDASVVTLILLVLFICLVGRRPQVWPRVGCRIYKSLSGLGMSPHWLLEEMSEFPCRNCFLLNNQREADKVH